MCFKWDYLNSLDSEGDGVTFNKSYFHTKLHHLFPGAHSQF